MPIAPPAGMSGTTFAAYLDRTTSQPSTSASAPSSRQSALANAVQTFEHNYQLQQNSQLQQANKALDHNREAAAKTAAQPDIKITA